MSATGDPQELTLGLVISRAPWEGRSGRDSLDIALAAATLDWSVDIYFCAGGLRQLLAAQSGVDAGLPGSPKAWKMLPELSAVRFIADPCEMKFWQEQGAEFVVPLLPLSKSVWGIEQSGCHRLLSA